MEAQETIQTQTWRYFEEWKVKMLWKKDVLFCDLNPVTYAISESKEKLKRYIKDYLGRMFLPRDRQEKDCVSLCPNTATTLSKGARA